MLKKSTWELDSESTWFQFWSWTEEKEEEEEEYGEKKKKRRMKRRRKKEQDTRTSYSYVYLCIYTANTYCSFHISLSKAFWWYFFYYSLFLAEIWNGQYPMILSGDYQAEGHYNRYVFVCNLMFQTRNMNLHIDFIKMMLKKIWMKSLYTCTCRRYD